MNSFITVLCLLPVMASSLYLGGGGLIGFGDMPDIAYYPGGGLLGGLGGLAGLGLGGGLIDRVGGLGGGLRYTSNVPSATISRHPSAAPTRTTRRMAPRQQTFFIGDAPDAFFYPSVGGMMPIGLDSADLTIVGNRLVPTYDASDIIG